MDMKRLDVRHNGILVVTLLAGIAVGVGACDQPSRDGDSGGAMKAEAVAPAETAPEPPRQASSGKEADTSAPAGATVSVKDDPGAKAAIVGSWAQAREACNSGEAIRFSADGTYGFEGEGGNWDLKGEQLHFENVRLFEPGVDGETQGDPGSVKVLSVEADSMKWQTPDGTTMDYVRCPGVQ